MNIEAAIARPENQAAIDRFLNHPLQRLFVGQYLFAAFDRPTGYEAFAGTERQQPIMRDTYGVIVYLRRDRSLPRGYFIQTAYPNNAD